LPSISYQYKYQEFSTIFAARLSLICGHFPFFHPIPAGQESSTRGALAPLQAAFSASHHSKIPLALTERWPYKEKPSEKPLINRLPENKKTACKVNNLASGQKIGM
jgi:hypothetical protein